MSQLSVRLITKSYGDQEVLNGISFDLEAGERVGLVGVNGCGKSTLLRLLAGLEEPDTGSIVFFSDARISRKLLEQAPELSPEELRRVSMEEHPGEFRQALGELGMPVETLSRAFDEAGISSIPQLPQEELHTPTSEIPTGSVAPLHQETIETYSGGERMKLALSGVLAEKPALLLMDEPTNHLDYEGITSLIDTVNTYDGTLLMVSHDRYFLDCTVTRILELEQGKVTEYLGNYSDYRKEKALLLEEKLHRWEEEKKQQERVEQTIHQIKDWSAKAHRDSTKPDSSGNTMGTKEFRRAKAKRMEKQIKSQVKRLERMRSETEEKPSEEKKVYFQIQSDGKRGKRIIEAEGISKSYGENLLFSKSDFVLLRGEHVAVFGPNGCGKTTFVRMLQGLEEPDSGRLWLSPAGEPYVLSQGLDGLPKGKQPLNISAPYGAL